MAKYDVIIINYNGEKIIRKCLESVFHSEIKPTKVIVYDNASSDRSVEIIKSHFPRVMLIKGNANIGFGRANNEAMKHADSEFILFINNDLILDERCSEVLAKSFSDSSIAIINPMIYKGWDRKKGQDVYAFGSTTDVSGFNYGLYDKSPDRIDLNCFSGACFMARATLIKKLKFEKSFFLYYEEAEMSARILKGGLKIARVAKAKSYHLESHSSLGQVADGISFRQYYGVQNRWFMLGKHWPFRLMLVAIASNMLHLLYVMYFFTINGKFHYTKIVYNAPWGYLRGLADRDKRKPRDAKWYAKLAPLSPTKYFKLGRKVFTKS